MLFFASACAGVLQSPGMHKCFTYRITRNQLHVRRGTTHHTCKCSGLTNLVVSWEQSVVSFSPIGVGEGQLVEVALQGHAEQGQEADVELETHNVVLVDGGGRFGLGRVERILPRED
eukprot:6785192-Alexandrium_andersonii.AAC.1